MKRRKMKWMLLAGVMAVVALMVGSFGGAQNVPQNTPTNLTTTSSCAPKEGPACCKNGVPTTKPGEKCIRMHKVGKGEDLHILAAYYYGDARMWPKIYKDNRCVLRNPNRLVVGQILRIEVAPCWAPKYDLQCFVQIEARRKASRQKVAEAERVKRETISSQPPGEPLVTGPAEETAGKEEGRTPPPEEKKK